MFLIVLPLIFVLKSKKPSLLRRFVSKDYKKDFFGVLVYDFEPTLNKSFIDSS